MTARSRKEGWSFLDETKLLSPPLAAERGFASQAKPKPKLSPGNEGL